MFSRDEKGSPVLSGKKRGERKEPEGGDREEKVHLDSLLEGALNWQVISASLLHVLSPL